jgi:outer membrane biosynthesis protein TonB
MPTYIAIILIIGIVVTLVINFIPKKRNSSLEETPIAPEPTPEPETVPEPTTPDEVPYPKVDLPLPTGEAKSKKKPQPKKKPATKVDA